MCGHNPGNMYKHDIVFNTGVVWFASDSTAIKFAKEWAIETLKLQVAHSCEDAPAGFPRAIPHLF